MGAPYRDICTNKGITTDPCKCWHFGSLFAQQRHEAGLQKHICKLCKWCSGSPYETYELFKQACLADWFEQYQKKTMEQHELEDKRLENFYAAEKQANFDF